MTLEKERARLVAAREEIDHTIRALDQVLAYLTVSNKLPKVSNSKRLGRPPKKKRRMSPEGEARRLAGLRAWHKKKLLAAKKKLPELPAGRKRHSPSNRVPEGFWAKTVRAALAAGIALAPAALRTFAGQQGTEVTYKAASMAIDRYRKGKL
jgi:hypothetical protein